MEVPYVAHAVPVMASQGHCQLKETVLIESFIDKGTVHSLSLAQRKHAWSNRG